MYKVYSKIQYLVFFKTARVLTSFFQFQAPGNPDTHVYVCAHVPIVSRNDSYPAALDAREREGGRGRERGVKTLRNALYVPIAI